MLTSVTIENFRNLDCLTLERLGRVTLIGGQNGSGKTALLEALFLFSAPNRPELSETINFFRGLPSQGRENIFRSIFNEYDTEKPIRVSACGDWGDSPRILDICVQERRGAVEISPEIVDSQGSRRLSRSQSEGSLELVFGYQHDDGTQYDSRAWWGSETLTLGGNAQPIVNEGILQERQKVPIGAQTVYMPPIQRIDPCDIASRFGKLQLEGEESKALDFIRPLEPRLRELTPILVNDNPIIHARLKGVNRPIPMQLMGEGINRMFNLVLVMTEACRGLVLVDEIENGLHHKVQEQVFSNLLNLARAFDVQVFATTHSSECLRAAYWAHEKQEALDDFAYYRLDRIDGMAKAFQFDSEMIETAIELNWEIR